jgi:hypothetical protein
VGGGGWVGVNRQIDHSINDVIIKANHFDQTPHVSCSKNQPTSENLILFADLLTWNYGEQK